MASPSTPSSSSAADHELWGWQNYFKEMEHFISETEQQFGSFNEDYAQYAIDRFEFCVHSASRLRDHLAHHRDSANEANRQVLSFYGDEACFHVYDNCVENGWSILK